MIGNLSFEEHDRYFTRMYNHLRHINRNLDINTMINIIKCRVILEQERENIMHNLNIKNIHDTPMVKDFKIWSSKYEIPTQAQNEEEFRRIFRNNEDEEEVQNEAQSEGKDEEDNEDEEEVQNEAQSEGKDEEDNEDEEDNKDEEDNEDEEDNKDEEDNEDEEDNDDEEDNEDEIDSDDDYTSDYEYHFYRDRYNENHIAQNNHRPRYTPQLL